MAESLCTLNAQPYSISVVKARTLNGKEWDPKNWNGNIWLDSDEAWDTESLNSAKFYVRRSSLSSPEEVNPPLTEEPIMASLEAVTLQDTANPQNPPLFASRPLTRLKSEQAPKGEVLSVTDEEVCYTLTETARLFQFMQK